MPDNNEPITGVTGAVQPSEVPQFATAEYAHIPGTERCRICSTLIGAEYYRVNGQMACAQCAAQAQSGQPTDSHSAFFRALMWGIGGCVAGLILYSTVAIVTGWTIGYLALAVGWLVAKGMMKGSNGIGGTRYQIAAVVLTYAAISMSAIPVISYAIKHPSAPAQAAPADQSSEDATAAPSGDAQTASAPKEGKSSLGADLLQLAFMGLASPFLELQDPRHGVIGLVILFVGLSIAFRLTAARPLAVDGPYAVRG